MKVNFCLPNKYMTAQQISFQMRQEIPIDNLNNRLSSKDHHWEVSSGLITVNIISRQNKIRTVALLKEGDFIYKEYFTPDMVVYALTATILQPVNVLSLTRFQEQLHAQLEFSTLVHYSKNNVEKTEHFIKYLARYGHVVPNGILLPYITQEQIGNCLSISRIHICKAIKELTQRRVLIKEGRRLVYAHLPRRWERENENYFNH